MAEYDPQTTQRDVVPDIAGELVGAGFVEPILIGHGAGSEVMSRIAAPVIGGMLTAPLLSMLVIPAGYLLLRRRRYRSNTSTQGESP